MVTNWTNTVSQRYEFDIERLALPHYRDILKHVFSDPEKLKPGLTRQTLTEQAATEVAAIAADLRGQGYDPQVVAHFLIRLVFCMFAEDADLPPNKMLTECLRSARRFPDRASMMLRQLFAAMKDDGGLFDSDDVLPLNPSQIDRLLKAADRDWSEIEPSILGTLFERGLDPTKRGQLGKYYTDRDKIMLILDPVIRRRLLRRWEETHSAILEIRANLEGAPARKRAEGSVEARRLYEAFLEEVRTFTVLDLACGSGNFLNLALQLLKDIEWTTLLAADELGFPGELRTSLVSSSQMKGTEINEYAVELARALVWIADLQWLKRQGQSVNRSPILQPLDTIECRDALLNADGTEATWPEATVIVGTPPFIGGKKLLSSLGKGLCHVDLSHLRGPWAA